jgi:Bacterial self-protective colicin-like immunity
MKENLSKYVQLIHGFVYGEISVNDFERDFLVMVKNEDSIFDVHIQRVIGTLFSDVDAYCGDPEIANYDPDDPFSDIDEQELKKRAENALRQLLESIG